MPYDVLNSLRSQLRGRVIGPGDDDYDDARAVFYRVFDGRPDALVRPADVDDVATVVRAAGQTGVPLAIRSGGHSPAGHGVGQGGVVLDLGALRGMELDRRERTAWAGAGLTAGAYTARAGEDGLATPFGDSPSVGLGGIALAGGIGFLHRRHGLTVDNLLAAEVVTADGRVRVVDRRRNPDIFWGLRGGGGNLGVVTRFRFRLHPVDRVLGGVLAFPGTPETLAALLSAAREAPDDLSAIINVMRAPPMPFLPREHHGRPLVMVMLVQLDTGSDGGRAVDTFRRVRPPLADLVRPMRYPEVFDLGEPPRSPALAIHTAFADRLDRQVAATAVDAVASMPAGGLRAVQFRVMGGAVARVPEAATAFAHRGRAAMLNVVAGYEDPAESAEHQRWVDGIGGALSSGEGGAYVGFLGGDGPGRMREAYPAATWERLAELKRRYDPENLFRFNHNVPPQAAGVPNARTGT